MSACTHCLTYVAFQIGRHDDGAAEVSISYAPSKRRSAIEMMRAIVTQEAATLCTYLRDEFPVERNIAMIEDGRTEGDADRIATEIEETQHDSDHIFGNVLETWADRYRGACVAESADGAVLFWPSPQHGITTAAEKARSLR